jgi:hypothetical protein
MTAAWLLLLLLITSREKGWITIIILSAMFCWFNFSLSTLFMVSQNPLHFPIGNPLQASFYRSIDHANQIYLYKKYLTELWIGYHFDFSLKELQQNLGCGNWHSDYMHMHQKILNGTLPNKQLIVVSIRSGFTDNLTGEYEISYT